MCPNFTFYYILILAVFLFVHWVYSVVYMYIIFIYE